MNVLVACEESQRVTSAFREKGHNAFSCDLLATSGSNPEWHIQQDVIPLLNGNCSFYTCDGTEHFISGSWDMIIAFPPCVDLATSGARWFKEKRESGKQEKAIILFGEILNADCKKIVVENPIGIISGKYIKQYYPGLCKKYNLPQKPAQIIQPWQFGEDVQKTTCLWEKGVAPLQPLITEKPDIQMRVWVDKKGKEKSQSEWYYQTSLLKHSKRSYYRSKTFFGIANAMADQWG